MSKYFAKVMFDESLQIALSGHSFLTPRLMQLWGLNEDENGLYFYPYADRCFEILHEAESLACNASQVVCRLFADQRNLRWLLSLGSDGNLIEVETKLVHDRRLENQRGQRKFKEEVGESFGIELSDGLKLSIWNPAGRLAISDASSFLGSALVWCKRKRKQVGSQVRWNGFSPSQPFSVRNEPTGWMGLWSPVSDANVLDWERLCKVIVHAHTASTTIENLKEMLPTIRENMDSPELRPVIDKLDSQRDGLGALQILVESKRHGW